MVTLPWWKGGYLEMVTLATTDARMMAPRDTRETREEVDEAAWDEVVIVARNAIARSSLATTMAGSRAAK